MTKRPVGLSARKAKKQKTEEELVLEVSGENEMEELDSLFQTAVEYLDTDPEQAKMLLRGCIHECDKMVRIRHGDIPNATEEEKQFLLESIKTMPILPQQFHLIYANALYYSSLVEDEALGFLDQSIDRAHIGLESQSEHTKELLHCLARSTIQKALISEEKQKVDDYKQSLESLLKQDYSETLGQLLLELAHFGVTYADKLEEKKERLSWLGYVMNAWEFVQRQSEDVQADIGVGNTWLVKADILMEDEEEKPIALLEHAIQSFEKALTKDGELLPVLCKLGEAHVHMGNLTDQEDEENEESLNHYKKAVDYFKRVLSIDPDALPEQFVDFVSDWEKDIEELTQNEVV